MKRNFFILVLLLLASLAISQIEVRRKIINDNFNPFYDLAIQNVTVFESEKQEILKHKTILIKQDTIVAIVNADNKIDARVIIEGRGRLVTSGFIDTHVHLHQMLSVSPKNLPKKLDHTYRKKLSEKILSYGTTTVLDMGQPESWMPETIDWQKEASPNYPNYFITGAAMISKGNNPAFHHVEVENPVEKVSQYDSIGNNYIKLYSRLKADDMASVVKEATKRGMRMYAHTEGIGKVTISEAMEMGVKHFEHFFTILPSILDYSVHWDLMEKRFGLNPYNHIDDWSAYMLFFFEYIKEKPELEEKLLQLLDRMAAHNATISTTIHVLAAAAEETAFFSSFNHFPVRDKPHFPDYTSVQKLAIKKALKTMLMYLKIAHDKGIEIRIGTDNREVGRSMISEFMLLYKAGFSVEDILQIATWNGAKAMRLEDDLGTVKPGYKADLVLFDKNPFDNHENFNAKKTIIKGGKVFTPKPSVVSYTIGVIEKEGVVKAMEIIDVNIVDYEVFELLEIGYHFLSIGKVKDGETILNFIMKKFPDFQEVYVEIALARIGSALMSQNLTTESVAIFELITEKFPKSFLAFNYLGQVYAITGKHKDAIIVYKKAIALNPKNKFGIAQLKKLEMKK